MNADIKAKWIAALRSGEYRQAIGRLRTKDDEYCCLGVLCDLIAPKRWKLIGSQSRQFWTHIGAECMPEDEIQRASELDYDPAEVLATMNDSGKTFPEIADYIEQNL